MRVELFLFVVFWVFVLPCIGEEANAQVFRQVSGADEQEAVLSITRDLRGFIWSGTTYGLKRYDSRRVKPYFHDPTAAGSIASNYVRAVFTDSRGILWVGTDGGVSVYKEQADSFVTFNYGHSDSTPSGTVLVTGITEDNQGRIWVGSSAGLSRATFSGGILSLKKYDLGSGWNDIRSIARGGDGRIWVGTSRGLVAMDPDKVRAERYVIEPGSQSGVSNEVVSVFQDKTGTVWLGTGERNLVRFDPVQASFSRVDHFKRETGERPTISGFSQGRGEFIWIATFSGLARVDPRTLETRWFVNSPRNLRSLSANMLLSLHLDDQDGLWLGSYHSGLSHLQINSGMFAEWFSPAENDSADEFADGWFGQSKSGQLWSVSEAGNRLALFDSRNLQKVAFSRLDFPSANSYQTFYMTGDNLVWAGGKSVLSCFNIKGNHRSDYVLSTPARKQPVPGTVRRLLEDGNGRFLAGGSFGLLSFDPRTGKFDETGLVRPVVSLFKAPSGDIWCGGKGSVYRRRSGAAAFETIPLSGVKNAKGIPDVWRVSIDGSGRVWAVTTDNLWLLDAAGSEFTIFNSEDVTLPAGLTDIQIDRRGFLWLSAGADLLRFHPDKGTLQFYGYLDGLVRNAVLRVDSGFQTAEGVFYYPTNKGPFLFNPADIRTFESPSSPVLTNLKVFNKEVMPGDRTGVLSGSLSESKELVFRHDQNVLTLEFELLSYSRGERKKYEYKLEGFDKQWNETPTPSATYTNLPSGKYTFTVKAANGDGYWGKEPLRVTIVVLPPWWKTWLAYFVYLVLLIGTFYWINRFFWLRKSFRKENELYRAKLDFFTNISHEIRTHLSLISAPVEKAFQLAEDASEVKGFLGFARNNSVLLMQLVNELLDFRKMQAGAVRLHITEVDLSKMLSNVLSGFELLAQEKGIATEVHVARKPVLVWVDPLQFQKVLYNLLGNAFKYTQEGGHVSVDIAEISSEVTIRVINYGPVIAPEHLEHLFTNFFQGNDGSGDNTGYGIGLALSKEIVDRHHGSLSVDSRHESSETKGRTCFTIRLLKGNSHFETEELKPGVSNWSAESDRSVDAPVLGGFVGNEGKKYTLLLAEDNMELRTFTTEALRAGYNVLEAENGSLALDIARERLPDLIVSDIMMPEMDGLEFCRRLKEDWLTSHIPVILLTARNATSQVLEGLDARADEYLVKPFDLRVLELKIRNLIRGREELKHRYSRSVIAGNDELPARDPDAELLKKLEQIVIENVSNPDFGVNEIALETGISVSVLYRKLRAITGMTVNDFMKTIRMNRAQKLLETGAYSVNEVAMVVGFEDSKYFSREFQKKQGKKPNDIRKQVLGKIEENRKEASGRSSDNP